MHDLSRYIFTALKSSAGILKNYVNISTFFLYGVASCTLSLSLGCNRKNLPPVTGARIKKIIF